LQSEISLYTIGGMNKEGGGLDSHNFDAIFAVKGRPWRWLHQDEFKEVFGVPYTDPEAKQIVLKKLDEIIEENNRLYHLNDCQGLIKSSEEHVKIQRTARHFGFALDPPETKANQEG